MYCSMLNYHLTCYFLSSQCLFIMYVAVCPVDMFHNNYSSFQVSVSVCVCNRISDKHLSQSTGPSDCRCDVGEL